MSKHTPTPWRFDPPSRRDWAGLGIVSTRLDGEGNETPVEQVLPWFDNDPTGMHYQRHIADLAFICRAVNAHDDLLELARRIVENVGTICGGNNREALEIETWEDMAREAIAKAEGKTDE